MYIFVTARAYNYILCNFYMTVIIIEGMVSESVSWCMVIAKVY